MRTVRHAWNVAISLMLGTMIGLIGHEFAADALGKNCGVGIKVRDYHQHATGAGSDAQAVSFIEAETTDGRILWGVGMDANIVTASLKAVTSAANRSTGRA